MGLIKHTFNKIDTEMFRILYKSMVRPILEYCMCVWSPYTKNDTRKLEQVQRRATRLVQSMHGLPYTERLIKLGIPSLQYRRLRNDMIQVFKILHGMEETGSRFFFD